MAKSTYNCPDCVINKDMLSDIDICLACNKVFRTSIPASIKQWTGPYRTDVIWGNYNPCADCSNSPTNGGSGFCNCALPAMYNPTY